ncbi:Integrin beta-PS [Orchesella cincta]|uniref:Integrin beta n=1 Tax=Orchesella cincta TaxID=48709 RepID=A0A1D2N5M3_ORCCI|nr:Integrin beta-PS [Orchesella cincta]
MAYDEYSKIKKCCEGQCKLHRLLEGPVRSFPGNASLAQYFSVGFIEERISENQIAIIHDEKQFTFRELEETSTRLSEVLKETVKTTKNQNPDNDSVIAVCLPPSEKLIFVLFAIHKIGATYVPIDVSFPEDRVFKIVKDCKPLLIISDHQTKYVGKFGIVKEQMKVVTIQDLLTLVGEKGSETEVGPVSTSSKIAFSPLPGLPIVADRTAVILYTSGSTGEPKGVRLGHRAVMNRLSWQWQEFPYTPDEVCAFKTSLTFVDSVPEIFGPLLQGYPIVIFEKQVVAEPAIFMEKLSLYKITRVTLVPSLLRAIFQTLTLVDTAHGIALLNSVKLWICSGEALPFDLVTEFFELYPRRYTLCNFYGSTEVMGDVTYVAYNTREEAYKKVLEKKIPIGVPVNNTVIYVLDKEMNMAENGDVGEIYIAGYNLATNYVGGSNSDKFVENSYTRTTAFKTLYKTGDYGRIGRTTDGTRMLFYEGRVDSQVKVRGQRIDLAEVELALSEIHLIQKVVVLCYRPGDQEQMILAYVVPLEPSVTLDRLEPMITKRLRDYERPIIKFVDSIPLLVNGKTDRQRLLKMFEKQLNHREEFEDWNTLDIPETKIHETKILFRVIAEVTGTSTETLAENIDNSFFNVGGTSLNAVTVVVKLRAHHLFISLRDFVHAKTIRHLLIALSMMEDQVESEESLESASRADSHLTNRFSINALEDSDKEETVHTIAYSFSKKGDLEAYTKASYDEFKMMIESIWPELVSKGYSSLIFQFLIKDKGSINMASITLFVLLFTFILISQTGYLFANNSDCTDKVTTCDSCIAVGCAWCKDLKEPGSQFQRCNTIKGHNGKCSNVNIEKAERSTWNITKDEALSSNYPPMRVRPQEGQLKLAVGEEMTIQLDYKDDTDRPLDLYYIMDLSATMEDDKNTVSAQAEDLVKELQKITKDVRLGFGSFIDKPVLPFVSSSQLRGDNDGQGKVYEKPYGFRNGLSLTDNISKFRETVTNAKISRNLDEPEGTLDALMQAITCVKEIGWRNDSRKLIVVATDGPFHIAGDGKIGGIVRPNDMRCHMENGEYTHSTILDYPSIGEINAVILKHQVYVIFAVSSGQGSHVDRVYKELQKHIKQSTHEQLNKDSSNVKEKIRRKYEEISSTVSIRIDEVNHVDVEVEAKCPSDSTYKKAKECHSVGVGSPISFRLKLKLKKCPDLNRFTGKNQIEASFFGLTTRERLVINLSYNCQCKCNQVRNSAATDLTKYCSGTDASSHLSCGKCYCKPERGGSNCQCSLTGENSQGNKTNCVDPTGGTVQTECSNKGSCKCGQCECNPGYNGKYCQDSTSECMNPNQQSQNYNELCSGSNNGRCEKGRCICDPSRDGTYCECEKIQKQSCVEPGKPFTNLCNDHGVCACDGNHAQCRCNSDYGGIYCERCKTSCPNDEQSSIRCRDPFLQKCVKCRIQNQDKPKDCDESCDWQKRKVEGSLSDKVRGDVESVDIVDTKIYAEVEGTECEVAINSSCTAKFKYNYEPASQGRADRLQLFYSPKELTCIKEGPIILWIFGVILGVLLAGILGLLIWKLATHYYDTREYKRFEEERAKAGWSAGENPLYNDPMRQFENPVHNRTSVVPQ